MIRDYRFIITGWRKNAWQILFAAVSVLLFTMCSGGNKIKLEADTRYNFVIDHGDTLASMVRPMTRLRMTVHVAEKMKGKRDWIAQVCQQFVDVENKLMNDRIIEVKVFSQGDSFLKPQIDDDDWLYYSEPEYVGYETHVVLSSAEEQNKKKLMSMREGVQFEIDGISLKVAKRDHSEVYLITSSRMNEHQINKVAEISPSLIADFYFYMPEDEMLAGQTEYSYAIYYYGDKKAVVSNTLIE